MVCFSCGRPGHGVVNRCSRVDTLFPFLPPGWSVAVQDGQYRAVWPGGSMARFQSGKRGMVRAGGSASWTIGNSGTTDPGGGGSMLPRPQGTDRYGCHRLGMHMAPVGLQTRRLFHHWGVIRQCFPQGYTNGLTEGCMFWLSRSWDRWIRLFKTLRLGWVGTCRRCLPQGGS